MKKVYGVLTPLLISFSIVFISIIVALVVSSTSSNGWDSLAAFIFVFLIGGIALLIHLIVSIIQYKKSHTDYWLFVLYGYASLIGFSIIVSIIASIYNFLIG